MKKIPPANPVDWRTFGKFIFEHREADPGYYILNYLDKAGLPLAQLMRFCVGWCCYYNLGIAARASELKGADFYELLRSEYPTAKRASERRHFRGAAGLKAIDQWQARWPSPEGLVKHIISGSPNMGDIRKRCESVAQMGDYFKWKFGDLTEVLLQQPVQFRGWEERSPKVPQQGAALIATEAGKPFLTTTEVYRQITTAMRKTGVKSAYAEWREFDVQDAETICCVYKQYRSGGYTPGLRTAKAFARLHVDGGNCKTAKRAIDLLLENQPSFAHPPTLARILNGELIHDVREFV